MANITLDIANTGEQVPVNDVNLDSVTNTELITNAVSAGIVPSLGADMEYKMVGKTNMPITETATLAALGFADGDTIKVVAKPKGAN
ncbi:hypothetical protein FACS1894162_6110 [Bacteroidia bacterium]|nr:hypothetical protein FACS1894162_6110 [Bacteroidia bacterium]